MTYIREVCLGQITPRDSSCINCDGCQPCYVPLQINCRSTRQEELFLRRIDEIHRKEMKDESKLEEEFMENYRRIICR